MASTHLLGVFLTVLTYRGPQLVYHYYDPELDGNVEERGIGEEDVITWSDESSGDEALDGSQSPALSATPTTGVHPRVTSPVNLSFASPQASQVRSVPSHANSEVHSVQSPAGVDDKDDKEAVLPCGFEQDIVAEMLSPPESLCNKRFSLTVDSSMFVGIPVHILESGTWRPLKSDPQQPHPQQPHPPHPQQPSSDAPSGVVTAEDSPMRMFHVCFMCNPPISDAAEAEERIYHNVLVPLVRLLRQEQASKNYVWNEVAKMQRVLEMSTHLSGSERLEAVESHSELARALRGVSSAIARMEIARVMIAGKPRAFQVPLQLELPGVPLCAEEIPPQAYLSTSNDTSKEIGHDCHECYGLLLLGDAEDIVKEIDVDPKGPVAAMIRNIDPTSSLAELAKQNHIDIKQIVNLVWSLVYWRRARIVIPLNFRYVYSVSPLAATERLYTLAKNFHDLFPVIPPLQRFLSLLSTSKPKPFIMHVPSSDHRPIYMRALAWLLQKDLVVHLPTFAQILITRKIKLASMNTEEDNDEDIGVFEEENYSIPEMDNATSSAAAAAAAAAAGPRVDDTIAGQLRRRKWLRRQSSSHKAELEDIQESVIMDPRRATTLENRWLAQVAVSGVTRSPELAALFQRLVKYFNAKDNIEQVMVREKISREEMRRFLQEFNPYILTYRHW